jgi:hypothetical protein
MRKPPGGKSFLFHGKRSCVPFFFLALAVPEQWIDHVNEPQTEAELEAVRRSVRGRYPFGSAAWQRQMAAGFGLGHTLRPLGRPKKNPPPAAGAR